jgi:hypothetical protein
MAVLVDFEWEGSRLTVHATCEEGEPKRDTPKLAQTTFFVDLELLNCIEDVHPDHLALVSILVFRPWISESITFNRHISKKMANVIKNQGIKVHPIDERLESYKPNGHGYIGLAYSGGADSTAALAVLPSTTVPVFLDRPERSKSLYAKDAALASCSKLKKIGYRVQTVPCDLESVREPIGFPTDLANGVPAILLSNRMNLTGISFGTVFESLYGIGRTKFKDYEITSHKKMWWELFEAAGLPLSFPVGGVSEVGTELICAKSPFESLARSCIRGTIDEPCNNCWKCFRKSTVRQALGLQPKNPELLKQLLASKEVRMKLSKLPISHEDVLLYSFSKLGFKGYPVDFRQRFSYIREFTCLECWYPPSLNYIHPSIRKSVQQRMNMYLETMTTSQQEQAESWNLEPILPNLSALYQDNH